MGVIGGDAPGGKRADWMNGTRITRIRLHPHDLICYAPGEWGKDSAKEGCIAGEEKATMTLPCPSHI